MEKLFTEKELETLFGKLKSLGQVFTPAKENKLILLKEVSNFSETLDTDDYINTVKPIKEFFFKQREIIYDFDNSEGEVKLNERIEKKDKRILWGIRPCEAQSLRILDKVYNSSDCMEDKYKTLRDNTLLIGFTCLLAGENCFCKFIGGSPFSKEGLDILVTKKWAGKFYVESNSSSGEELISSLGQDLKEEDDSKKKDIENRAEQSFKRGFKVPDHLPELFENVYWEKVSNKCISCGICRFLCPTCHCFDMGMEDEERVKYWDACAFKRFTQETSGVNHRWKKVDRYKQWVYHKYDYFKKRNDVHLCVGCGRCITHCPVKMDIIDIFKKVPKKEI